MYMYRTVLHWLMTEDGQTVQKEFQVSINKSSSKEFDRTILKSNAVSDEDLYM